MQQVTVRIKELKAALLFSSMDETRYVLHGVNIENAPHRYPLLVATNGRSIGVVKSECPADCDEKFERILSRDAITNLLKLASRKDEFVNLTFGERKEVTMRLSDSELSLTMPDGIIEGIFPKWRQVCPKEKGDSPRAIYSVNLSYLEQFMKAAALLGNGSATDNCHVQLYAKDELSPVIIRFPSAKNFHGILMPLRSDSVLDLRPDWVADDEPEVKPPPLPVIQQPAYA